MENLPRKITHAQSLLIKSGLSSAPLYIRSILCFLIIIIIHFKHHGILGISLIAFSCVFVAVIVFVVNGTIGQVETAVMQRLLLVLLDMRMIIVVLLEILCIGCGLKGEEEA